MLLNQPPLRRMNYVNLSSCACREFGKYSISFDGGVMSYKLYLNAMNQFKLKYQHTFKRILLNVFE